MSETSPLLSPQSPTLPSSDCDHVKSKDTSKVPLPPLSLTRGFLFAFSVFVLIFIITFGVSIITTTQSSVARDLGITEGASWLASAYLIANTSVTPVAGKLCKIFSLRLYLLVSTFVQAAGLLITAFAGSFAVFTLGRVICGVGSAAVTPLAFLSVTEFASERHWGFCFGLVNCAYTAGLAVGGVVGGALDPLIGWRAVFWTQVPVCLIASLIAFLTMPAHTGVTSAGDEEKTISRKLAEIDYLGMFTLIGTIVAFLYTLASTTLDVIPVLIAISLATLFSFNESRWASEPILPPALICSRPVALSGIATLGLMCARWEVLFYTPTYGIAVLGWNQSQSGLLLVPTNLGFATGSVVVGVLHIKKSCSYYIPCLLCFALFALEHFALSRLIAPGSSIWLLVVALFMNGFIAGALLNYSLAHLLHQTPRMQHVTVIPLVALFRGLSGSLGSALSGGIFARSLQSSLRAGFSDKGLYGKDELISQLLSRPMLVQSLHGSEQEVAVASYATSIRYLVTISCTWVVAMLLIQAGTGWRGPEEQPRQASSTEGIDPTAPDVAGFRQ